LRALAELVMRGRMQACSIAFIGFAFPFVSSAVIGLVTLRKGSLEGFIVMLWAILPVLLSYIFSENNPYLAVVSGILVLTSLLVAVVLRMGLFVGLDIDGGSIDQCFSHFDVWSLF